MNKLISQVMRKAGFNAKVSKDSANPRFKVVDNKLTLEGKISNGKYTMQIKDNKGKLIDNLSVSIGNQNDVVNRLNESLNTLRMLSSAYDRTKLIEEDEEYDTVSVDDDIPESLEDGLNSLYNSVMDVASKADELTDVASGNDAEQLSILIGFSSALYDIAIDVDDYYSELTGADEVDESVSRKVTKTDRQRIIDALTIAESLTRKNKNLSDIRTALRDIRTELTKRGFEK